MVNSSNAACDIQAALQASLAQLVIDVAANQAKMKQLRAREEWSPVLVAAFLLGAGTALAAFWLLMILAGLKFLGLL